MATNEQIKAVYESRKNRVTNPVGKFDNQGRWYPSDAENSDGYAGSIRTPSRAYPYSYMTAARSLKHIKALAEANPEFFATLIK